MKKVLVLIKRKDALNKKTTTEVLADFLAPDVRVYKRYLGSVNFYFNFEKGVIIGRSGDEKLDKYDLIYLRTVGALKDQAYVLANFCKKYGLKIIESNFLETNSNSKLVQLTKMMNHGISAPNTYFQGDYPLALKEKDFPIIVKKILGKGGDGVFLIKNQNELNKINKNDGGQYIYQQYIPNSYDWRIVVIGGKAVYSCKRVRKENGDFRNNIKLGAEEIVADAPLELKKTAEKAAKAVGLSIAGVDIIGRGKTHYVIEINRSPSFTKNIKVSDEIPQLGKYIRKCLNRK